ncbi:MAG: UDP-glucose 6-dehydrogenase [Candidatus Omnitrophica bacterium CG11_big_fil_rev_8_21_14_0_20_42_13]|uniref:UDP-glucose 6-dehydrogenase n=1 Tax=Candidatus Ghiorseimicrobium undicola TaxID=1974746 RepID=A0A2H0LYV0_9BACT|nr:MAG: UDP-glucose 6-dehydrogenase [Candidatus Omnitrophica bacterium CG11_big_fil_rev_8_21_14_0_20_42_13]
MNIVIVGTGYVGLVSGTCFAELGNNVICVDNNKKKIENLKKFIMPIYEPGLDDLMRRNVKERRLSFSSSIKQAVKASDIIFICVGTPSKDNGDADLTYVENVAREIALSMDSYRLIVDKSTVPVETGKWVAHTVKMNLKNRKGIKFDVASCPEFLREGHAIDDFMRPDRIVIGAETKTAVDLLTRLFRPLKTTLVVTDINSAELIKHASNSFLAAKISFINAVSRLCEKVGADVTKVAYGMGLDRRIGRSFLDAGIGYGGSCFPKDVDAFIRIGEKHGCNLSILKEARRINSEQIKVFIRKIEDSLWVVKDKTIGLLGLSFKPGTDDLRNAPSLEIVSALLSEGAKIKAFDPQAMPKARTIMDKSVKFCADAYKAAAGCDCLVIITEWDEFKSMDLTRIKKSMKQPLIIDGRNIFEPRTMEKMGIKYLSMGR